MTSLFFFVDHDLQTSLISGFLSNIYVTLFPDVEWLSRQDSSHDLLAVLPPPYSLLYICLCMYVYIFIYVTLFPDVEWLSRQDSSHDLLAVLHPPYSLVLWNADTGAKLWKKTYTETLQSFAFDPYDPSKLACEFKLWYQLR